MAHYNIYSNCCKTNWKLENVEHCVGQTSLRQIYRDFFLHYTHYEEALPQLVLIDCYNINLFDDCIQMALHAALQQFSSHQSPSITLIIIIHAPIIYVKIPYKNI